MTTTATLGSTLRSGFQRWQFWLLLLVLAKGGGVGTNDKAADPSGFRGLEEGDSVVSQ